MFNSPERIEERQKIRLVIAKHTGNSTESILLLISEILDDYLEHRIEADKVLQGILKDIQANTAIIAEKFLQNLITGNIN